MTFGSCRLPNDGVDFSPAFGPQGSKSSKKELDKESPIAII